MDGRDLLPQHTEVEEEVFKRVEGAGTVDACVKWLTGALAYNPALVLEVIHEICARKELLETFVDLLPDEGCGFEKDVPGVVDAMVEKLEEDILSHVAERVWNVLASDSGHFISRVIDQRVEKAVEEVYEDRPADEALMGIPGIMIADSTDPPAEFADDPGEEDVTRKAINTSTSGGGRGETRWRGGDDFSRAQTSQGFAPRPMAPPGLPHPSVQYPCTPVERRSENASHSAYATFLRPHGLDTHRPAPMDGGIPPSSKPFGHFPPNPPVPGSDFRTPPPMHRQGSYPHGSQNYSDQPKTWGGRYQRNYGHYRNDRQRDWSHGQKYNRQGSRDRYRRYGPGDREFTHRIEKKGRESRWGNPGGSKRFGNNG